MGELWGVFSYFAGSNMSNDGSMLCVGGERDTCEIKIFSGENVTIFLIIIQYYN